MSLSVVRVMLRLCFMASSVPLLKEYLVISVYVVTPFFFIVSHKGSKVINRISSCKKTTPYTNYNFEKMVEYTRKSGYIEKTK